MSRGSFLSVARAVAWRNIHNWATNPALFVPGLLFPLFFFTAFAGGLSRIDSVPGFEYEAGYTTFVYGFVLLQAATFGGVFSAFSIARDFESGFSRRLMLGAANRGGIVAGYWIAALVRAVTNIAVITAIALVVGLEIHGNGIDMFGLYRVYGDGRPVRRVRQRTAPAGVAVMRRPHEDEGHASLRAHRERRAAAHRCESCRACPRQPPQARRRP